MAPDQQDILIRIQRKGASLFSVQAILNDGGVFSGDDLTIPDRDLLALELDANAYGALLGKSLFSAPILRALERATGELSRRPGDRLRVRLTISPDADELHYYAWERIFIPWMGTAAPLSASGSLVFSRFLELEIPEEDPLDSRPIRITVVVSNPSVLPRGMAEIQVEKEVDRIAHVLAGIPDIQIRIHAGRTPLSAELRESLQQQGIQLLDGFTTLPTLVELAGNCDVLHILSHGTWGRDQEEAVESAKLFLEDENEGYWKAPDTEIQRMFSLLNRKPRMVFLAACDSAARGAEASARSAIAPPIGLAPRLVAAGIPAVIAMRSELEMDVARQFAAKFYAALLDHGEVDLAISQARLTLYQAEVPSWAIPVVFLRIRAGRLFREDPVNSALRGVLASNPGLAESDYLCLEAVSLKTPDLIADWERASKESIAAAQLWRALRDFSSRPPGGGLLGVIGDSGSGKSTQLLRLARALAEESLSGAGATGAVLRTLPVTVDLSAYHDVNAVRCTRMEELIFRSIVRTAPFFPRELFHRILTQPTSARLCLLVDGGDALDDETRRGILNELSVLAADQPFHCFIVSMDCRYFDPGSWAPSELLVIRMLTPRLVERYLRADSRRAIAQLLEQIIEANLFDLAAVPWLLLYMREMALGGAVPRARSAILASAVEQRLSRISAEKGLRSRARRSLSALAWLMHSTNREKLSFDEAFHVFRQVREARDYSLEALLQQLVEYEILVLGQPETVRFAYPALQACCVARYLCDSAGAAAELRRITDTLGRPERMQWWEHVLVLYAGLVADPMPFLESLVFGVSLTQGEQLFLASLCLSEVAWKMDGPNGRRFMATPYLSMRDQICSALQWRARRINETSWSIRLRAVQALGRWRRVEAIPFLCEVALQPAASRGAASGSTPAFEYSQIRLAAVRALRRMAEHEAELRAADPAVPKLLDAWQQAQVYTLEEMLNSASPGVRGVAAFALGDLRTEEAQSALFKAFISPNTDPATLWAISDAFLELEPEDVLDEFRELICLAHHDWRSAGSAHDALYERFIYLIGEMRADMPEARDFVESFLKQPVSCRLKGRSIIALGKLRVADWRPVWEKVAGGNFEDIQVSPAPDNGGSLFLRRKAIEALGEMGSLGSLLRVRRTQAWDAELDESFFWATERTVAAGNSRREEGEGEKYDGSKRLHAGGV